VLSPDSLGELQTVCEGAIEMTEGGYTFVYLPALRIPGVSQTDALLCIQPRDGY
jgi:hypothetical protein